MRTTRYWSRLFVAGAIVALTIVGITGCRNLDREAAEHPTFKTPPRVPAGQLQQPLSAPPPVSGGVISPQGNSHF